MGVAVARTLGRVAANGTELAHEVQGCERAAGGADHGPNDADDRLAGQAVRRSGPVRSFRRSVRQPGCGRVDPPAGNLPPPRLADIVVRRRPPATCRTPLTAPLRCSRPGGPRWSSAPHQGPSALGRRHRVAAAWRHEGPRRPGRSSPGCAPGAADCGSATWLPAGVPAHGHAARWAQRPHSSRPAQ